MRRLTLLALAIVMCLSGIPGLSPTGVPLLDVPQTVAAQDDGYTPVFEASDCPFGYAEGVTCGYLTVPEDRADPGGVQIHLAVAILHAEADTPAPDPVVFLSGGPGSGALGLARAPMFDGFRAERDVILIDQRGTGYSQPNLSCPETQTPDLIDAATFSSSGDSGALFAALAACRARLEGEGVTLSAYTSASNAADIDDLRRALGIEQWNLFGVSYGTRLAQTIMRDHPDGVRSAILDAVVPLERNLASDLLPVVLRSVETLLAGCADDEICSYAFPDLETRWVNVVNTLQADPYHIVIRHPILQERTEIAVDGVLLMQAIFAALYNFEHQLNSLPLFIYDLSEGNYIDLNDHLVEALALGSGTATGMTLSLNCAEEIALTTLATAQAAFNLPPAYDPAIQAVGAAMISDTFAGCEVWDVPAADPREGEPVVSDIPALLLNGSYDPVTPPAYAEMVHANLPNSTFYEFPAEGHGVFFANTCGQRVAQAFLADPTATPTDSCLDHLSGPVFLIPREAAHELAAQREAEEQAALAASLTPVTLDTVGVSLLVLEDWTQDEPGVFAGPEATLIVTSLAGSDLAAAVATYFEALEVRPLRRSSGELVTDTLAWTLYRTLVDGQIVALGAAVVDGATLIVALRGPASGFPEDLFAAVLELVASVE